MSGSEDMGFDEAVPFEALPAPASKEVHNETLTTKPREGNEVVPSRGASVDSDVALIQAVLADPDGGTFFQFKAIPLDAFPAGSESRKIWRALKEGIKVDDILGLSKVTGLPIGYLIQGNENDRSGLFASTHADVLMNAWRSNRIKAMAESGEVNVGEWRRLLDEIERHESASAVIAKPITAYEYPSGDDPGIILGSDDYLGRGGGMLLVSHAGAGKSSLILNMCMSYAVGRPWMGIRSNGPQKSLIIQAEDSDRYIGKIRASFEYAQNLTADEKVLLEKNCIIVRLRGVSGDAFFAELRRLVAKHSPDIVILNPIYIYAEGDISRSEFAQPFLVNLDAINKEEKFAYILVHHTGKPAQRNNKGERPDLDDWETVYMGFGSSYLANWPRCSILLEPIPKTKGRYQLKLGKGGMNAGITKKIEQGAGYRLEAVTRVGIKHSDKKMPVGGVDKPVIFWEVDDAPLPVAKESDQSNDGPPQLGQYLDMFPRTESKAMTLGALVRASMNFKPITREEICDLCEQGIAVGVLRKAGEPSAPAYWRPEI